MKEDLLGPNHWLSLSARCQTVRPRSSALSSGHLRTAPPKSSSCMPKCFRYHAASAALSPLLLKKTPPIPVTFAIVALLSTLCGYILGSYRIATAPQPIKESQSCCGEWNRGIINRNMVAARNQPPPCQARGTRHWP